MMVMVIKSRGVEGQRVYLIFSGSLVIKLLREIYIYSKNTFSTLVESLGNPKIKHCII
jgi:hypothetical protein